MKKKALKQEIAALTQSRAELHSAVTWLLDMIRGRWTAADDCPMCVRGEGGNCKCSTFCAELRIEWAEKVLKENPL